MDADGTRDGFDLELIRLVRAEVGVPVVASGGAGEPAHFAPAVEAGADAVLAASVFHFGDLVIGEVKDALRSARSPRPLTAHPPASTVPQRESHSSNARTASSGPDSSTRACSRRPVT